MTKVKIFTPIIAIAAGLILSLTMLCGCASGSSSSSSNSKLYKNYGDIEGVTYMCALPSSETLVYGVQNSNIKSISFVFTFQDAYGDEIGEYFGTLITNNGPIQQEIINGLDEADSAQGYIYSYVLEDGTTWGNNNLPQTSSGIEEAIKYGKEIEVGINKPLTESLSSL